MMTDDDIFIIAKDSCLKNSFRMGGIGALIGKVLMVAVQSI